MYAPKGSLLFFTIPFTGKLNVSVKCNKRSLGRRNAVNKKNSLSAIQDREQGCEMIKHEGDRPESPNTTTKPQNTSVGMRNEKNELDVDNKMIAHGKIFRMSNWLTAVFFLPTPCSVLPFVHTNISRF